MWRNNQVKKATLTVLMIAATFSSGFSLKTLLTRQNEAEATRRVTGLGGIFFKCKDPAKVREWYKTHLGLNTNQYGTVFEWRQGADTTKKGFTQWSPFKETTKYFEPSTKDFMINYRVQDLEALVEDLTREGVTVLDTIETYSYGKFVHILDVEGNKLELWEPDDIEFEKLGIEIESKTTK
jgi:predicted enzyme related to lactoylglutathione lyase